jgi:hypothetical protein
MRAIKAGDWVLYKGRVRRVEKIGEGGIIHLEGHASSDPRVAHAYAFTATTTSDVQLCDPQGKPLQ